MNKLKIRKEASLDFHHKIVQAVYETIEKNTNDFPFQSCLNCLAFNEQQEFCSHWNAKPPARVIVFGCDEHDDIKDIPF